jgi:DNA repair photolyase
MEPYPSRGCTERPDSRFAAWQREAEEDDWPSPDDAPAVRTELLHDHARSVLTFNRSPDIPFDRSINPYRGCEHGCAYCFARPSHAYLGLSPGRDFETRIACKPDAAARLREELARPGYRPATIALGVNTDAWQPLERKLGVTRSILEVLAETRHPVSAITKSALIERDIDLLQDLARDKLTSVAFSITSLDADLARRLEPRAPGPARRLAALARVAAAGVPVCVMVAPVIPALNDHELERILAAAAEAGASSAGYVLLRLPGEVLALFEAWLARHAPGRARHVMSVLSQMRGGRPYDARFGSRMSGEGEFAHLLRLRMRRACARLGLALAPREAPLNCTAYVPRRSSSPQRDLFA